MADGTHRVRVEGVDWANLLPFVRLFGSFRMAIHPAKLGMALLLVVLLYMGGRVLDLMWGPRVYPGEAAQYATLTTEQFEQWRDNQNERTKRDLRTLVAGTPNFSDDAAKLVESPDRYALAIDAIAAGYDKQDEMFRNNLKGSPNPASLKDRMEDARAEREARLSAVRTLQPRGIFETALQAELTCFERMVGGASRLNFGLADFLSDAQSDPGSVAGALRDMFATLPAWLYHTHPWFLLVYCLYWTALWALLGGSIARLAAFHATRGQRVSASEAVRFAGSRWLSFVTAPLIPVMLAGVISLLMALGGLVFFNFPVLDIFGGLLFIFPLLGGVVMSLLLIGLAAGGHLLFPVIAVEGTDAFDAISRTYNYVLGRPWRVLFYTAVGLVYGAITYLFVGFVIYLTLLFTRATVGWGAIREARPGVHRFETILPPPHIGQLTYRLDNLASPDFSGKAAGVLVFVWVSLLIALLAAFAISFYFCANTWVYLLLRRAADGTSFDEVHVDPPTPAEQEEQAAPAAAAKVDASAVSPEASTPEAPAEVSLPIAPPTPRQARRDPGLSKPKEPDA